jgi:hypothetical protein
VCVCVCSTTALAVNPGVTVKGKGSGRWHRVARVADVSGTKEFETMSVDQEEQKYFSSEQSVQLYWCLLVEYLPCLQRPC